jgi:hypothetical protein
MSLSVKWVILIACNCGAGDAQKGAEAGARGLAEKSGLDPNVWPATSRKPTADIVGRVTTDGRCWRKADLQCSGQRANGFAAVCTGWITSLIV